MHCRSIRAGLSLPENRAPHVGVFYRGALSGASLFLEHQKQTKIPHRSDTDIRRATRLLLGNVSSHGQDVRHTHDPLTDPLPYHCPQLSPQGHTCRHSFRRQANLTRMFNRQLFIWCDLRSLFSEEVVFPWKRWPSSRCPSWEICCFLVNVKLSRFLLLDMIILKVKSWRYKM